MAHFAKLDDDNTVLQVQVVDNPILDPNNTGTEDESLGITYLTNIHGWTNWKQTSYNNNFRKKYAAIGDIYDSTKDKFIIPKPFSSWSLDSNDDWKAPVDYPTVLEFGDPVQPHLPEWNETELRWDDTTTGKVWDPNTSSWVDS
jgi:hypothetical protein|tara:strand:- start:5845 stop:6276 length:432 start_codon:yes stop_codon:yes gene_type:complete